MRNTVLNCLECTSFAEVVITQDGNEAITGVGLHVNDGEKGIKLYMTTADWKVLTKELIATVGFAMKEEAKCREGLVQDVTANSQSANS